MEDGVSRTTPRANASEEQKVGAASGVPDASGCEQWGHPTRRPLFVY